MKSAGRRGYVAVLFLAVLVLPARVSADRTSAVPPSDSVAASPVAVADPGTVMADPSARDEPADAVAGASLAPSPSSPADPDPGPASCPDGSAGSIHCAGATHSGSHLVPGHGLGPDGPLVPEDGSGGLRSGSLLATGAAVFPGVLLHGAGHYVLGQREDAKALLKLEALSLGAFIGGMALMGSVGAAEQFAPIYVLTSVGGMSVFVLSWMADLIGSARGTAAWHLPRDPGPGLYLSAGYAGLFASPFDLPNNATLSAAWRGDRFELTTSALANPRGDYLGLSALAGWRVWQADADPVTRASIFVALRHQDFSADRFRLTTGEVLGELRWNLGRFAGTLRNAWLLGRVGWGVDGYGYDAIPEAVETGRTQFIVEAGLGVQATARIGAELLYRHRKNELPGGLLTAGFFDSFFGMLELQGRVALSERWTLLPGVRYGTGVMPWIAVESRVF